MEGLLSTGPTPSSYCLPSTFIVDCLCSIGAVLNGVLQGDVIPTVGGGRQVVFSDVEVLTQVKAALLVLMAIHRLSSLS